MPALREEYDYYEYARNRQGTVKKAVPSSSNLKKNYSTGTKVQAKNLKTTTTRDITRNSTRIAMQDDFIGVKKKSKTTRVNGSAKSNVKTKTRTKTSSKVSLDPVVFNNKKTLKKPQEMTLTKPKSVVKAKAVEKQKAKVKEMLKNFVVVSLVFGMFFLICYRYSVINEAFNELNDLKDDVKNKKTINAQLESNIKQNTDLAYIENYAKYQLGMQKPKDSQIQKVSAQKQDKIILPIEIMEEEEKSFFDELVEKVLSVF